MIHPYNNSTQTLWGRGEVKVQLSQPNNPRPIGYSDGNEADEAELQSIAEQEGAEFQVEKRILKTGREIWTLSGDSS